MDWVGLFEPHRAAENVVRASAVFLLLFVLLRILPNRKTGSVGPAGLLVLVLLATMVNGAVGRDVSSISAWSLIIDSLANRVPFPRRLLHSEPVEHDGRVSVIRKDGHAISPVRATSSRP